MNKLIIILILLSCIPVVTAIQGEIHVLTIAQEESGNKYGEIAKLHLDIQPGNGRVFLDTFPLSRIGTQISMRFAQQIACKEIKKNCKNHDFIYTVKANSGVIAGPSAGAAATILTMSLLTNTKLNKHVAITGTINSGGYIGPVGGVKEKIDAAKKNGITTILIPTGDRFYDTNNTELKIVEIEERIIDLVKYGQELNLDVIEVSDLDTAWYYFTGERKKPLKTPKTNPEYTEVMKILSEKLCKRSELLTNEITHKDLPPEIAIATEQIINISQAAEQAYQKEQFYTSASFCFRTNVAASSLLYQLQDPNETTLKNKITIIKNSIKEIEDKIDNKKLETINDLQTFMIVKERLREANNYLTLTEENINNTLIASNMLAFAGERLYSAVSWSEFFSGKSTKFNMDKKYVEASCKQKLSEAEERYNYLNEYVTGLASRDDIKQAFEDYQNEDYALCLFRAAKAKAEINVFLNMLGIQEHQLQQVLQEKLAIAKNVIIEQQEQGIFPIVGYSYYEYAISLAEDDLSSSLLFAEYALELGNLDIYFPRQSVSISFSSEQIWLFLLGVGAGILITCYMLQPKKKPKD